MASKRRSRAMIGINASSLLAPIAVTLVTLVTVLIQPVSSVALDFFDFDGIEQSFAMDTLDDDDYFMNRGGSSSSSSSRQCATITDLICRDEDFSILCTALRQTGLDAALDSKSEVWTLFAPTDEAFETLDMETAQTVFTDVELVQFVLLYHTIAGREVFSRQLECSERIMMANMKETRTVCSGDQVFQKGGGNAADKKPEIVDSDVRACNGVIHVVNNVILPTRLPGSNYANSPTRRPVYYVPAPPTPYKTPTKAPYREPTRNPTYYKPPTRAPYRKPTRRPSPRPSPYPTPYPTRRPTTRKPSKYPTPYPVAYPEPTPYYPDDDGNFYPDDDGGNYPDHQEPHYRDHQEPYHPDQDDRDGRGGNFPCLSVGDLICQTGGLDLLCEAFHITGLFDFMQIGFDWTVFAPTNEAIEKLIQSVPEGSLNADNMRDLLLFQMIESKIIEFSDLRCEEWVQMADGGFSYTHCRGLDKYQVGRGNGFKDSIIMLRDSPIILREDIGGCNGIVHTVDTVLLPAWWLSS